MSRRLALIALVFAAAAIALAGLAPFEFARLNRTAWLDPGPGLRFDGGGLALSRDSLEWGTAAGSSAFTVEAWVRVDSAPPGVLRGIVVLLDGPSSTVVGLRQQGAHLVVWDRVVNPDGAHWYNDFLVADAFETGRLQHVAVSCDGTGPKIYVDGQRVEPGIGYDIAIPGQGERVRGQLVVGAMPPWTDPWSGELLALVLYDRAIGADALASHAQRAPDEVVHSIAGEAGVVAAYAFDERGGDVVHDSASGRYPLELPRNYRPPIPTLLAMPDARHWTQLWFAMDAVVNFLGFVPLGFLLVVVLASDRRRRSLRVILWSAAIGLAFSLGIEISQVVMVTRSSSLSDLVLNTLGSIAGAVVAVRWRARR